MNYFLPKSAAERYAKGRPDFHGNTIEHIRQFLQLEHKLPKALDIACGTGLSTKALLAIAENVYGTDTSEEMLKWALKQNDISYSIASAENQPFIDNEMDLITVSSGVHWFNIDAFLKEANRLLKSQGWLVLYDNYFISEMESVPEFGQWFSEVYLKQFSSPKRNDTYEWTNENLQKQNFSLAKEETFKNAVSFSKEQLVLYFTTQSNITAAVESGSHTYVAIEAWLNHELSHFFGDDERRTIFYGNWIKYIRRNS